MRSRLVLFAVPLAMAFAPAVSAQTDDEIVFASGTGDEAGARDFADDDAGRSDQSDTDSSLDELADKMSNRDRQDRVANSVERMTAALLDVRVGALAAAIENTRPGTVRRDVRRNSTVGDLAGRDSDHLPEQLGDRSRQMMGMMGGFAQAMAGMMPELKRIGRELEVNVRAAKDEARRD